MSTTSGGAGGFSTLLMYRCNPNHTKISTRVTIDGEAMEDAPGQIWAQYGLMDHTDLGRSTPGREGEEGCLCFVVFPTPVFWCLV